MIIKNIIAGHETFGKTVGGMFGNIVKYVAEYIENGNEKKAQNSLRHNLQSTDLPDIIKEFEENYTFAKPRQGGAMYRHEVISFHPNDTPHLTDTVLRDITRHYLKYRAPNALAYANVHRSTSHVHVHIVMSSNQIRSNKRLYMSKREFLEIQQEFEKYVNTKYPYLTQTSHYQLQNRNKHLQKEYEHHHSSTQKEQELIRRYRGISSEMFTQKTKKMIIKEHLEYIINESENMDSFIQALNRHGMEYYHNGATRHGVIVQGVKYRFSTLGIQTLPPALQQHSPTIQNHGVNTERQASPSGAIQQTPYILAPNNNGFQPSVTRTPLRVPTEFEQINENVPREPKAVQPFQPVQQSYTSSSTSPQSGTPSTSVSPIANIGQAVGGALGVVGGVITSIGAPFVVAATKEALQAFEGVSNFVEDVAREIMNDPKKQTASQKTQNHDSLDLNTAVDYLAQSRRREQEEKNKQEKLREFGQEQSMDIDL